MQGGRITKSELLVMVAHDTTSGKDCFPRGVTAVLVYLSKFGTTSGKKYGEPLEDPLCVCGFENALSAGRLIDFEDPV